MIFIRGREFVSRNDPRFLSGNASIFAPLPQTEFRSTVPDFCLFNSFIILMTRLARCLASTVSCPSPFLHLFPSPLSFCLNPKFDLGSANLPSNVETVKRSSSCRIHMLANPPLRVSGELHRYCRRTAIVSFQRIPGKLPHLCADDQPPSMNLI